VGQLLICRGAAFGSDFAVITEENEDDENEGVVIVKCRAKRPQM
jgi:hypothetical protein